ncbi:DegT/DnrJ/EryC1/StrS family aminotransferase [Endothiovibrio diazotrophicus]
MLTAGCYRERYLRALGERLPGAAEVFLFYKGRVALYAALRAMGVGAGDEVVVPGYTCVVVPNAVMYTGATPVYADVSPGSYTLDVERLREAIGPRTKVIVAQNTYGLSHGLDAVAELARERGVFLVEDCAHGFGGRYRGRANGATGDAAIFSSQWNKPFSTGIGGFLAVNNPDLVPAVREACASLVEPSRSERWMLRLLFGVRTHLVGDRTYWAARRIYRRLSALNLVVGSSSGEELVSPELPDGYFKGMSGFQAQVGLRAVRGVDENIALRKANGVALTRFLRERGKNHVGDAFFADHSFLTYPLLVEEREAFFRLAEEARVPLGDWFVSPLHPVTSGLERWGFDPARCPVGTRTARKMVNLPTDQRDLSRLLGFLERHLHLITDHDGELRCRADAGPAE